MNTKQSNNNISNELGRVTPLISPVICSQREQECCVSFLTIGPAGPSCNASPLAACKVVESDLSSYYGSTIPSSSKPTLISCDLSSSLSSRLASAPVESSSSSASLTWVSKKKRRRLSSSRDQTRVPGLVAVRSMAVRKKLFLLVKILFQYLERVDPNQLQLAKMALRDSENKHRSKDSKYPTLADAIYHNLRDTVGEKHWANANKIYKQMSLIRSSR